MYPRNAASPEPVAIGAVVQISDGAVQTSGVTVRIKPIGVSEGDGTGTTSYSTDGIVYYTPTQAETNYTSFILIAKKTGCIPVAVTVVTSASATAGYAGVDWSKVTAPTTTLNLSGTTIKTATDVETDTVDIQSRLPAALVSGRMDSSTGAMAANVLTASALASDAVSEIQSGLATATDLATVDGIVDAIYVDVHTEIPMTLSTIASVVDAILTDTGTTLQAELDGIQADTEDIQSRIPAALVSGRLDVSVGAYQSGLTPLQPTTAGRTLDVTAGGAAGIDWANIENQAAAVGLTSTTVGTTSEVGINGITASSIALDAIGASELASDAVTEIANAVWASATRVLTAGTNIVLAKGTGVTGFNDLDAAGVRSAIGLASANLDTQLTTIDDFIDSEITAIKSVTDKLDTAMELDSTVYRFTTNALEQAPSGGGGGSTDWTSDERTAIRTILGIPASGTTPDVPSAGALKVIDDFLDTEVAAIKAKTDLIPTFPANFSSLVINVSGSIETVENVIDVVGDVAQIGDGGVLLNLIPWNAAWDTEVQSECADALTAYDPPTNAEMEARTLAAASYGTAANQTTILARLGSWTGSGINTVLGAFRALMAKASALTPTDISTGTTFDNTTDSLEAVRDRGDSSWITGSGSGGSSQAVIGSTNAITRNINESLPIQFTWNSASATITGTVELGVASAVACQGAVSFVRTDAAGKHWYQLAYDADDRPTVAGLARYVFTDGTDYLTVPVQFTEVAGGTGGGTVLPTSATQLSRVEGTEITAFVNENLVISQSVYDASSDPVNLSAYTLKFVIATKNETHVLTITSGINVTGADSNTYSLTLPDTFTDTLGSYQYSLRDASSDIVLAHGPLLVRYAATE